MLPLAFITMKINNLGIVKGEELVHHGHLSSQSAPARAIATDPQIAGSQWSSMKG